MNHWKQERGVYSSQQNRLAGRPYDTDFYVGLRKEQDLHQHGTFLAAGISGTSVINDWTHQHNGTSNNLDDVGPSGAPAEV